MSTITDYYEKYDEDGRITSTKARKVEFTVTTTLLNQYIKPNHKILELGAGTGVYSFYYANRGNEVTATDLTLKHVEIIKQKLEAEGNNLRLHAEAVDATDLSQYESESYDVVTCLGPMYHLTDEMDRKKCIQESLRVLKPGGILGVAYINKHYIIHAIMTGENKFLTQSFIDKILNTGVIKDGEKECFWTDAFFTSPEEMEAFISKFEVEIIDHAATDGINPLLRSFIDKMDEEEYDAWINYCITNCREKSTLGISNHALLLCRKIKT